MSLHCFNGEYFPVARRGFNHVASGTEEFARFRATQPGGFR
jgi:hypothetical protein